MYVNEGLKKRRKAICRQFLLDDCPHGNSSQFDRVSITAVLCIV